MGSVNRPVTPATERRLATAEAESAVRRVAQAMGGDLISEQLHTASSTAQRTGTAHGLAATRLEQAAQLVTEGYVRAARAERMSWQEPAG